MSNNKQIVAVGMPKIQKPVGKRRVSGPVNESLALQIDTEEASDNMSEIKRFAVCDNSSLMTFQTQNTVI